MKLSTKGRYGLKAMLDLAIHQDEGYVSLKSIAERQVISESYLEQLFANLKKSNLVKSIRGSQGGYTLSQEPRMITVGAILRSLEGSLAPVDCVADEGLPCCNKQECCVTKTVWQKIHNSINEVVDTLTLENLLEDYKNSSPRMNILE